MHSSRVWEQRLMQQWGSNSDTRLGEKVGRNDDCPCGSGKKYKKCHGIEFLALQRTG